MNRHDRPREAPAGVLRTYRGMPPAVRLVCTACIGVLIGLLTYEIVYALNPLQPRAASSWLLAYAIGIARQHALHRWLSFDHYAPYWSSLGRAYLMYSGSALLGTALNAVLTQDFGLHHRLAWLACLGVTSAISLLMLRRFVFAPGRLPA